MNKTAQNLTWNCLPLEVKQEVKRQYQIATDAKEYFTECTLEYLFGSDNLTSDAEGEEDEMLYVSRKKVQKMYSKYDEQAKKTVLAGLPDIAEWDKIQCDLLKDLFGSKCLPDACNVASNVASSKPKPAEPKYHVGQKVKFKDKDFGFEITAIEKWDDCNEYKYKLAGWKHSFRESVLEPCTEPNLDKESSTCTNECPSQCPSQDFENIIKDGFRGHNRLYIAAILAAGMLANDARCYPIDRALELADKLIAEAKKGDTK